MMWLNPVLCTYKKRRTPDTSKGVVINGKYYRSLTEAARSLGCSITKIYRMIGK